MQQAASTWRGCGRAAWMRASKAHSVPFSASRLSAPAMSATSATFSASTTASAAQRGHQRRAVGQRQPFLGRQLDGRQAGRGQRLGAGHALRRRIPPRPGRSSPARCAPAAPGRPTRPATPGSARSDARRAPASAGAGASDSSRMPECPLARVLARISIMARTIGVSNGAPTPTEWLMTMLRCKLAHLIGRDEAILERAEAGGDAVDDPALGHELLHRGARPADFGFRLGAQAQGDFARRRVSHCHDVFDGQTFAVQHDVQHLLPLRFARYQAVERTTASARSIICRVAGRSAYASRSAGATHSSAAASSPACTAPPS